MFAAPPDLPPPPITAQQQSNLDCLSVGLTLVSLSHGKPRVGDKMIKVYLSKLNRSDPGRDWRSLARPEPNMRYGDFMGILNRCQTEMSPRR